MAIHFANLFYIVYKLKEYHESYIHFLICNYITGLKMDINMLHKYSYNHDKNRSLQFIKNIKRTEKGSQSDNRERKRDRKRYRERGRERDKRF